MTSDELAELCRDNPGLPVLAMVDNDLCDPYEYAYTFQEVRRAQVAEVAEVSEHIVERDGFDYVEFLDVAYDGEEPEDEWRARREYEGIEWVPCVLVWTAAATLPGGEDR
jgi:hypothetical protein